MTTITAATRTDGLSPAQRMLRQLGHDTVYVLIGFPLAIAAFTIIITGLSAGGGLLVTIIGLPVLVATLYAARGFAHLERARIRPILRRRPVPVVYKQAAP